MVAEQRRVLKLTGNCADGADPDGGCDEETLVAHGDVVAAFRRTLAVCLGKNRS